MLVCVDPDKVRCDCRDDHLLVKILKRKSRLLSVAWASPGLAAAARRRGKVLIPWNVEMMTKLQQNIQYSASHARDKQKYKLGWIVLIAPVILDWLFPLDQDSRGHGEGICIEHGERKIDWRHLHGVPMSHVPSIPAFNNNCRVRNQKRKSQS